MTTREFYETKAKECGYDDFLHWIDCSDYTLQPQKIVEWTDELVKNLTMHSVSGSACRCERCTGLKSDESFYED